jgi:hypothetical protein
MDFEMRPSLTLFQQIQNPKFEKLKCNAAISFGCLSPSEYKYLI